ncbi:MAG: hypothetical protein KDI48_19365, partial [Xanthomonadales bacterium]|nr:hypothetical protein [Xanthomonadales bacterium]
QLTLDASSAGLESTTDLLYALEKAADAEAVRLQGEGALNDASGFRPINLRYELGRYRSTEQGSLEYTRSQLIDAASSGQLQLTLTARMGHRSDLDHPQPALWTSGPIQAQRGRQQFPSLSADDRLISLSGRHIDTGAYVFVDGERVAANVRCASGSLPECTNEALEVQLSALPSTTGIHFLQVQNPDGLVSNEFIFHTLAAGTGVAEFDVSGPWAKLDQAGHGWLIEQIPALNGVGPDQLVVYWYVYLNGEPAWLIGQGDFVNGRAELETYVTAGANFPPAFDPASVDLIPWGRLSFEFADNETGSVRWSGEVDGYGQAALNIQRIAPISSAPSACHSGSYYNLDQPGHGFVAQVVEVNGQTEVVLAWYVYRDGQQLWLFGQAPLVDGVATVPMLSYRGAQFPPDFSAASVAASPWGTVTIDFSASDAAQVQWQSELPAFGSGALELTRLTRLVGHSCS